MRAVVEPLQKLPIVQYHPVISNDLTMARNTTPSIFNKTLFIPALIGRMVLLGATCLFNLRVPGGVKLVSQDFPAALKLRRLEGV